MTWIGATESPTTTNSPPSMAMVPIAMGPTVCGVVGAVPEPVPVAVIVPVTVPVIVTEPVPDAEVELLFVGTVEPLRLPAMMTCPLGPRSTWPRLIDPTLPLTSIWALGPSPPKSIVLTDEVRGLMVPSSSIGAASMLPICPDLIVRLRIESSPLGTW